MATIKGVWVFNESLTLPQPSQIQQEVNFTFFYLEQNWQCTHLNISEYNNRTLLNYVTSDGSVWAAHGVNGWGTANQAMRTVDFGSVEQEVSEEWYTWLTANATPQASEDDTPNTLITYDGVTVGMKNGQTATFKCAGKKMKTNVVVVPVFDVYIAYDGVAHAVYGGDTAVLMCEGKKMRTDVAIISNI